MPARGEAASRRAAQCESALFRFRGVLRGAEKMSKLKAAGFVRKCTDPAVLYARMGMLRKSVREIITILLHFPKAVDFEPKKCYNKFITLDKRT